MWATHTLFKLPGFNCVSLVASPPLLKYLPTPLVGNPHYKNPGYAPDDRKHSTFNSNINADFYDVLYIAACMYTVEIRPLASFNQFW